MNYVISLESINAAGRRQEVLKFTFDFEKRQLDFLTRSGGLRSRPMPVFFSKASDCARLRYVFTTVAILEFIGILFELRPGVWP